MQIGYATTFQNPHHRHDDKSVVEFEMKNALLADELGFDSVWATEHHFTDYEMTPNPLQFLTWVVGASKRLRVGTMVIVLPWHDPVRVAEEIAVLENLSDGRLILGIGRGLATVEFDGFRIDMNESRDRFVESAQVILESLETGIIKGDGPHYKIPARALRPVPPYSFVGRSFGAGASPASMPILAKLGVGFMIIPTKSWAEIDTDWNAYKAAWAEHQPNRPMQKPLLDQFVIVDRDEGRAREKAERYIRCYYEEILKHYDMAGDQFKDFKGYEQYAQNALELQKNADVVIQRFIDMQAWGTPEQVIEKLRVVRDHLGMSTLMGHFLFGGMPFEESQEHMRLFAEEVMPTLRSWEPDPYGDRIPSAGACGVVVPEPA